MSSPDRQLRFGWHALALFMIGAAAVVLLGMLEQQGIIGRLTEDMARFVVFLPLLIILVVLSRKPYFSASIKWAALVCAVSAMVEMALSVTEEVRSLEKVAVIGNHSAVRPVIENLLAGAWICSIPYLFYLLLKSVEAAQRQAVQRERLRAMGEMSHSLAHDLNNTLSPVVGYAELLQRASGLSPENQQWAAAIAQNASDAAAVVQKLQQFNAHRAAVAMERVDLREIVERIPHLTRPRWKDEPEKSGREIDFELRLSPESAPIGGDPVEIRQMLVNLVFNAVDAMPEGGTLLISLRSTDESVTMRVSDTGIGMNEEEQRRCLEPYYSTKADGSGLGLSVSFGIVERHGGSIALSSREGAGTTFEISFPRMEETGTPDRETPQPASGPRGKRILYIDDDVRVRSLVKSMLQAMGHEVDTAEDGPSGLSKFRRGDYDLVITDLGMPGMDGSEVVQVIKGVDPAFPVALVSGWSTSEVAERFHDTVRPDWVIGKPVTLESLRPALSPSKRKSADVR